MKLTKVIPFLCLSLVSFNDASLLTTDIPTVDLSQPDEESAKILYEAATTQGFFYLTNHGVSDNIINSLLEQSEEFFSLDLDIKLSLLHNKTHWGYVPLMDESTDPKSRDKHGHSDTKEGFYLQNNINNTNIDDNHDILKRNQWPLFDNNIINTDLFSDAIINYMSEIHLLSNKILDIIALSLNLPKDFFTHNNANIHDDNAMDLLYLLHYPKGITSNINNGIYGTGEHSDYSLFTILLTDHNPGLQIYDNNLNKWINILDNRYKNSFIINIADTLELWTNNLFKSVKHRVVLNGKNDRYSVPYFVAANYDCIIDCLPINTNVFSIDTYTTANENDTISDEFAAATQRGGIERRECNHRPFKSGDYLNYKLKQTHKTLKNKDEFGLENIFINHAGHGHHNEL